MVKVGDVIKINDVVVEVETAKSLVELPSPYAGTVTAILVPEGETVAVGTPIIAVDDGKGGAAPAEAAPAPAGKAAEIDYSNPAATGGGENQTLVGYGPRSGAAKRKARRGPATAATMAGSATQMQVQGSFTLGGADTSDVVPADEPPVPAVPARETRFQDRPSGTWSVGGVLAKPTVRKLARDLGVDLGTVTPSGEGGIVTADDVRAAAEGGRPTPTR